MGHLIFGVMLLFFVVLFFGKLYFSYIFAFRKNNNDFELLVNIDEQGKSFYVQKQKAVVFGILNILALVALIFCFYFLKKGPEHLTVSWALWALVDALFLSIFICVMAFIKCLRSSIYIHRDGFEYFDTFIKKVYSKEDIEHVCRTSEFIFVKRKGSRMPVIIEAAYNDIDCLYGMLLSLSK